jgi:hypothetical protein
LATESSPRCGFCSRTFEAVQENIVKVKACGHEFHQECFFNQKGAHCKTSKKFKEILCPEEGCKEKVLKETKENFDQKIIEKIEIKKNPYSESKRKDIALFKKTAFAIVVFCVTLIAVAISPTWWGFAAGLGLSVPCGWLTGKILEKNLKNKH